jgi:DNA-binding transcriptional regulator LsrR (DeoR family)
MKKEDQEDLLLYRVAEMYYVMEYTLAEIASRIGVTPMTVSRLLKKAKEKGFVQINIRTPFGTSRDHEAKIKDKFGLKNAVVVKSNGIDVKQQIYQVATILFDLLMKDGITVGIGGGSAIANIVENFPERPAPGLQLIQLVGGFENTGCRNAYDILHKFAQKLGVTGTYFPVPIYVRDSATRDSLFTEVYRNSGLSKKVKKCSLALSGIGTVDASTIYVKSGLIQPEEMEEIKEAGGVGDIYGQFYNMEGQLIDHPINQRVLAVPFEELRNIDEFLLVGGGSNKIMSIRAALKIGMVTTLVTDDQTATELLTLN